MGSNRRRTEMASKKHRPEEAVAKLRQVDVLVSQGQTVAEAIRAIGVTEVTYYRWRREFGGLKSAQVKRLKALVNRPGFPGGCCGWVMPRGRVSLLGHDSSVPRPRREGCCRSVRGGGGC